MTGEEEQPLTNRHSNIIVIVCEEQERREKKKIFNIFIEFIYMKIFS
jgi:hypothetical protein